ncbi:B-cell scaffold protein with ankyrin repeats isoform X2 [Ahaetulla prasina]|uniref:B-cell scaffold protein with ankyrin repeats isoform X2 n=1 Tax=Ahaetulla prasina TaxID=499056 RepID=UPI00264777C8|nr:B-cell scaffold protein with ankyrin repeats isoform X2 [Ahaetulla prasina]
MAGSSENTQSILVIYEEAAKEWALYLKSIFKHIVLEDRILLYNLKAGLIHHSEVPFLCSYRCKLLIISNGLLKGLNVKKRYFLDKILQPPERVAILLCGVEDSALIYQTLNIDKWNQLMTTDQGPEDYLAVISDIIQQGAHDPLSSDLERSLRLNDRSVEIDEVTEMVGRPEVLVLPKRIPCEAFKFSSAEKMDNILTLLLKSSIISHGFSSFPNENEVTDHDQETDSQLEELPTLLHCAAKFGLKKFAGLLLQNPKTIQACSITNKYGENPSQIAKKYGQKEIWKLLKELPISEDKNTSDEKEIKAEDDIYVFMMSSDSHSNGLGRPSTEEPPGACLEIQKKKGMNADAELKEYNEEGVVEKVEGNKLEENTCRLRNSLYSNILRDVPEAKSENIHFSEGPPLPPRNQFLASKQNECFYLYSDLKKVEGQVENKGTEGEPKINCCSDEIDEEDPYTSAVVNHGVYDAIMENKLQEQRKDGRSFIMNRPPAPAPRPLSAAVKEEGTSYIAQDFISSTS